MKKRLLCLSLCLIMLLGMLAACKKDEEEQPATPTEDSSDSVPTGDTGKQYETDANGYIKDELPDTTYNGKEVKVLGWKGNEAYTIPKESGNTPLLSKIYYHKLAVEARLDIQLKVNYMQGQGNDPGSTIMNAFKTEVQSGAGDYDLIQNFSLYPAVLAQEGLLVNMKNLSYPHLDMPWWSDSISDWEQYGGLYFLTCNSSAMAIRSMFVMFSNTQMITDAGLTDPVDLVLDGKWTIETMVQYTKAFHGDAEANPGEAYGLVIDDDSRMDAFYYGAGFKAITNNADGVAEVTWNDVGYRTRVSDYIDTLVNLLKLPETEIANDTAKLMVDGKTALMVASMANIEQLKDNAYAALPMPKLEEDASYATMQNNGYDMWCIPKTTSDAQLAGVVLEAIASSEYRNIAPYYFETVLRDRYAQGADGMKVFDIIRNNTVYDFGRVCQFSLKNTVEGMWRSNFASKKVKNPNNVLESKWASGGDQLNASLAELLAAFRNNNRNS